MKYLLVLIFIFLCSFIKCQEINLKETDKITIELKDDSVRIINNTKYIKKIYKNFISLKLYNLKEPNKWFRINDWNVRLIFSPSNTKISFYNGNYIMINEKAYFSSKDDIEEFFKIIQ